ncbi:MAG: VCBS domain-containing protein, partial [Rhodoferax sp.]|nr:VCBS domain-containing protein [Rhodoferax sp.]
NNQGNHQGTLQWLSASGRDFEGLVQSAAGSPIYTITVTVTDAAGNKSSPQTITITLQDANDAPVNTLPAAQTVSEDSELAFTGSRLISVSDQDAGSNGLAWVRLTVQHGSLWVTADADGAANATGGLSASSISNNGTATLTLTGSAAAINTTLATLIYHPTANYHGADTLTVFSSDGGSPALTASNSVAIHISAVNDAPTLSGIPAGSTPVQQGVATGLGNFSVADADSSTLYVTLSPGNGSISGLQAGSDAVTGLATVINNDGSIGLTGSAAAINARLALLRFSASAAGTASMTVDVSDVALGDTSSHASATYAMSASSQAVPVLGFASGQDGILNSGDSSLTLQLGMSGLASGDTVQLQLDGSNLGSAYSVTVADVSAGKASLSIPNSSLGSDTAPGSSKALTAVVTQNGATPGTSPASNALHLTLDTRLPGVSLCLGDGVANGATLAEALASTGVVSVTAESGSTVTISFTDPDMHRITRVMTGTGNTQVITLTATEIGVYGNQLQDGTITVNAVVVDPAGNVNTAVSSFVLDTLAPDAPKLVPMQWSPAWIALPQNPSEGAAAFMSQRAMSAVTGFAQFSTEPGASVQVDFFANYVSPAQAADLAKNFPYTGDGATLQALSLSGTELAALNSSQLDLLVYVTDAAGNVSPARRMTYRLNPAELQAPVLAVAAPGPANTAVLGRAKATAGALTQTVAANLLVATTFADAFGHSVSSALQSTGMATLVGLPASSMGTGSGQLQDGTITATVLAMDSYANLAPASSISFVLDSTAPRLAAATLAANRGSIHLVFSEAIDSSALSLAAANSLLVFNTSSSGNNAISNPYSSISISGNT